MYRITMASCPKERIILKTKKEIDRQTCKYVNKCQIDYQKKKEKKNIQKAGQAEKYEGKNSLGREYGIAF